MTFTFIAAAVAALGLVFPVLSTQTFANTGTLTGWSSQNIEHEGSIDQVTNVVQQYVPEYTLMANTEAQIIYSLPARKLNQFGPLYYALEFQKQNYKMNNIKITNPTTGDIYPK